MRRCRSKSIRARCSSACSAPTTAPIRSARLARIKTERSLLDSVSRRSAPAAAPARAGRSHQGGRLSRLGPRHRAPHPEGGATEQPASCRWCSNRAGVPATFAEHITLMFDLMALAYQTDMTRVATFMIGREQSTRTYPGDRRPRAAPPAVASSAAARRAGEARQGQRAAHADVRGVPAEAAGHPRRRRHAARSRDAALRIRSEQSRRSQPPRSADSAGRRRQRDSSRAAAIWPARSTRRSPTCI